MLFVVSVLFTMKSVARFKMADTEDYSEDEDNVVEVIHTLPASVTVPTFMDNRGR